MTEDALDAVFLALASPVRRQILDIVAATPSGCPVGYLSEQFDMSRIGVLKHVNVLEDAGLLLSARSGRERWLHFNAVPLQVIQERWSDEYRSYWTGRLTGLKYAVERGESR